MPSDSPLEDKRLCIAAAAQNDQMKAAAIELADSLSVEATKAVLDAIDSLGDDFLSVAIRTFALYGYSTALLAINLDEEDDG